MRRKFQYNVYKEMLLDRDLGQKNPVHILMPNFFKTHFNIVISTHNIPRGVFLSDFETNSVNGSQLRKIVCLLPFHFIVDSLCWFHIASDNKKFAQEHIITHAVAFHIGTFECFLHKILWCEVRYKNTQTDILKLINARVTCSCLKIFLS
jgi:hypothetical protein